MSKGMVLLFVAVLGILVTGCASPKFTYNAPPARLRPSGPSIAVLPLEDVRTNKTMDQVLEKGYLTDVQKAIGAELIGADLFASVTVITNSQEVPTTDLRLTPRLRQLDWEVPNYDTLLTKTFVISLLTGGIGGCIYISTGTDVYGHASLEVQLAQKSDLPGPVDFRYTDSITNHMAKASSDTGDTKAKMVALAFQKTMEELKTDLKKNLH